MILAERNGKRCVPLIPGEGNREMSNIQQVPLLVLANKQDLPNVMKRTEIADKLGLHTLDKSNWYIEETSAHTGDGLYNGLRWLAKQLKND